ncbi:MAG TPA: biopolymer transporter ExbD [Kofleriaceae bacterium]|nr:biopolymer transporter ExbD [Kofleriaceae bacterium]
MPREAGPEVRAQGRRPRAVQEARGKVISGGVTSTTPPPRDSSPAEVPAIAIAITKRGEIFLGGARLDDAALAGRLRDLAARDKDARVVIQADRDVAYGRVVFVLDQAKQAGLRRISFATDPAAP